MIYQICVASARGGGKCVSFKRPFIWGDGCFHTSRQANQRPLPGGLSWPWFGTSSAKNEAAEGEESCLLWSCPSSGTALLWGGDMGIGYHFVPGKMSSQFSYWGLGDRELAFDRLWWQSKKLETHILGMALCLAPKPKRRQFWVATLSMSLHSSTNSSLT